MATKQDGATEPSQIVRDRMAELGIGQRDLAERVATLLSETPVSQPAMYARIEKLSGLAPATVFAIEEALGLPPGSVSQHLGYVPPSVRPALTFEEVVARDVHLDDVARHMLVTMYQTFVTEIRRQRQQRRRRGNSS
jgi:DNA-directed RNA polymerase specialized sigma54-like protein